MSSTELADAELLTRMAEYKTALGELMSLVAADSTSEAAFAQAIGRLAEFGPLLKRIEAGDLPASEEFAAQLQAVRLQHGMLSQTAVKEQVEVGEALAKVRELRRKAGFYGATGSEVGSSCDMAG